MGEGKRDAARQMARRYLDSGDPLGWFEALYGQAGGDPSDIPWADLTPNPNLVDWLDRQDPAGFRGRAVKIGSGLGDDAEELARRGFATTAFDISPTAVAWSRRRFPESEVSYLVADLFHLPVQWRNAFDFVLESYTLQVLPPKLRAEATACIADLVAPGGTLLVIARARGKDESEGRMPWPLTRKELAVIEAQGLEMTAFEDFIDGETPRVRRFRVTCRRKSYGS